MSKEQPIRLAAALAAARGEFATIVRDQEANATSTRKYKYADLGAVLDAVVPALVKNGIALTQPTRITDTGLVVVETVLTLGDETISCRYPVGPAGSDHQALGKGLTYARRYSLSSLLAVTAEDDTDGEGAAPSAAKGKRHKDMAGPREAAGQHGNAYLDEDARDKATAEAISNDAPLPGELRRLESNGLRDKLVSAIDASVDNADVDDLVRRAAFKADCKKLLPADLDYVRDFTKQKRAMFADADKPAGELEAQTPFDTES